MRNAGHIDNETHARRFENYLLSLSIDCNAEEEKDRWSVWIVREEDLDRAKVELAAFLVTPDDPRFNVTTAKRQAPPEKEKNVVYMRDRWQEPRSRDVPVTMIMVAVCVIIFLANKAIDPTIVEWKGTQLAVRSTLYPYLYFHPNLFLAGEYWRLISPMFGHHGFIHIAFNMYWLVHLGKLIEPRMSPIGYLLLSLVLSAASTILHATMASGWGMLGYSGVIFGLLTYAWMRGRYDPYSGIHIPSQTLQFVGFFWLIGWLPQLPIANWAHTGGALAGIAIGYLHAQWNRKQRQGHTA